MTGGRLLARGLALCLLMPGPGLAAAQGMLPVIDAHQDPLELDTAADHRLITGSTGAADGEKTASDYCKALGDVAGEARLKWQADQLTKLQSSVRNVTADLDAKRAELEKWVTRRDAFIARATSRLTEIFKQMKPDAAAAQLDELDDETAAAILLQLEPKVTSQIFNELPSKRGARLITVMSGATQFQSDKKATE